MTLVCCAYKSHCNHHGRESYGVARAEWVEVRATTYLVRPGSVADGAVRPAPTPLLVDPIGSTMPVADTTGAAGKRTSRTQSAATDQPRASKCLPEPFAGAAQTAVRSPPAPAVGVPGPHLTTATPSGKARRQ